ncbi:hypothetical protein MTO96_032620 [Rhipicephalus appendiculatus]
MRKKAEEIIRLGVAKRKQRPIRQFPQYLDFKNDVSGRLRTHARRRRSFGDGFAFLQKRGKAGCPCSLRNVAKKGMLPEEVSPERCSQGVAGWNVSAQSSVQQLILEVAGDALQSNRTLPSRTARKGEPPAASRAPQNPFSRSTSASSPAAAAHNVVDDVPRSSGRKQKRLVC